MVRIPPPQHKPHDPGLTPFLAFLIRNNNKILLQ